MFSKVLVANRGEIAIRIVRALQELAITSVAVYSELDRDALHAARADEAYDLGEGPASENYLSIEKILDAARRSGAEAIHPGYGFLAENAPFAAACEQAGIVFIGPPASAIEAMGSKTRARELMQAAGVPIVPGTTEPVATAADALRIAKAEIGFPVAVKAAGGGGGKGFRVALSEDELEGAFEGSRREGERFFSDPTVYLERYLHDPRHVEIQVLADRHGNVIHLGERDCSIQRRHQKLIEESPAPAWVVDQTMRERIGKIGVDAARAVDYVGAGTIEGLLAPSKDGSLEYFFLEMNTRVQVEHCVTEMTTGVDIVKEGIRAAAGEPLSYAQQDIVLRGHAIECRINAEDASTNFTPAPGSIGAYSEPRGPGVRVDSGVGPGSEVSPMYDPMVAKLIVWDADREQATRRMLRALDEYEIEGLKTLIPFHKALLATDQWASGETCRDLLEDREWLKETLAFEAAAGQAGSEPEGQESGQPRTVEASRSQPDEQESEQPRTVEASRSQPDEQELEQPRTVEASRSRPDEQELEQPRTVEASRSQPDEQELEQPRRDEASPSRPDEQELERSYTVEVSGKRFDVKVLGAPLALGAPAAARGANGSARSAPRRGRRSSSSGAGADVLQSPLQGNMWKVLVKQGDIVQKGQLLCIIEAMKMENEITAHKSGTITDLPIGEGAPIAAGAPIATIVAAAAD